MLLELAAQQSGRVAISVEMFERCVDVTLKEMV